MDYLNKNIARNLKRIRLVKGLSLDNVAEQTGVSKSILAQIERGEANPTIGTVERIISGLRISITELTEDNSVLNKIVSGSSLEPLKKQKGAFSVYNYFPFEENRSFEIYWIHISPGKEYKTGGHGISTEEYIMLYEGELLILENEESITLHEGDGLRLSTEQEHTYVNVGDKEAGLILVFSWMKM